MDRSSARDGCIVQELSVGCGNGHRNTQDGDVDMRVGRMLAAVLVWAPLVGCVHLEEEYFCRWHELSPRPAEAAIEQFRSRYPTTPVTTTRPGSWNKIEVGMTRGMVRTLVG